MIRTPKRFHVSKLGLTLAAGTALQSVHANAIPARISDEQWKEIAGPKVSETYEVTKGDTLSAISQRLFGDLKYWPKIWALNNDSITNPHLIYPGKKIAFMPGSGTSLPGVELQGEPTATKAPSNLTPELRASDAATGISSDAADQILAAQGDGISKEWRSLPPQPWERSAPVYQIEVDKYGFDRSAKVTFGKGSGIDLQAVAFSDRISTLGQVVGSRSPANYPTVGEVLYIRADGELQVGESYAVTQEPTLLKSRKSDRLGYSYLVLGQVKIIGVKDGVFLGLITKAKENIYRGAQLMPMPKKVPVLPAIPGPRPLEGILMVDRNFSTSHTSQFKQAFVDRGTDDGIRPGMVFRAYQYYDPSNEKKITDSDFIIEADMMVVQCSPSFSSVIVLNSRDGITENSSVVLLTDVSDLLKKSSRKIKLIDDNGKVRTNEDQLDQLDKLDKGGSIGKEEEKELKQLEKWESNPEQGAPEGQPNAPVEGAPAGGEPPTEQTPPPPSAPESGLESAPAAGGTEASTAPTPESPQPEGSSASPGSGQSEEAPPPPESASPGGSEPPSPESGSQ